MPQINLVILLATVVNDTDEFNHFISQQLWMTQMNLIIL